MLTKILAWVTVVLIALVGSSSQSQAVRQTAWNATMFTIKIPRSFPVGTPIFTLSLLSSPEYHYANARTRDSSSGNRYGGFDSRPPPPPSGLRHSNSNYRREETLAELRLPPESDDGGGNIWGKTGSMDAEIRHSTSNPHSTQDSPPKMVLCKYPKSLFHSQIQDTLTNTISLRLSRPIQIKDYVKYRIDYDYIEVKIGTNCSTRKRDENAFTVHIRILEEIKCDQLPKSACMLPETIELRQWENRPRHALLTLPKPSDLCPNLKGHYSLTIKEPNTTDEILKTSVDRLAIKPVDPLDREKYGSNIKFKIACKLELGPGKYTTHFQTGKLRLLDEDDNPPIRTRNPLVQWHYTNNTADLDDTMMVVDRDLKDSNEYEIRLEGNYDGIVSVSNTINFNVRKERCNEEAENITGVTFSAECMVLTPGFHMKHDENGKLDFSDCDERTSHCQKVMSLSDVSQRKAPPKIEFNVLIIDKSLLRINPDFVPEVSYKVELTLPPCESDPSPKWFEVAKAVLPVQRNISVTKPVNKYYRLHQLAFPSLPANDFTNEPPNTPNFTLAPESRHMGIAITRVNGILYVVDPTRLRKGEITVFRGDTAIVISLQVNLMDRDPCPLEDPLDEAKIWCSSNAYNTSCESTCGVASSGGCSWRPRQESSWSHYPTCSPDLNTCPDGICDEHEILHMGICPQDCVVREDFKGEASGRLGPEGRGVQTCLGLFTCNGGGNCVCSALPPEAEGPDTESDTPRASKGECDSTCQIGVIIGGLLFMALVVGVFLCRYRARGTCKQKGGQISLGNLPIEDHSSIAYNRDEPHDTVHHAIRGSPRPEHNFVPSVHVTIDQKWEFPRNRLVIEQTLGEGEFGKVMRARAQGINGTLGYTTVAVKMLKPNSTPSELNDLVSEYTLLKEVSHPNVVKLLGACTMKDGPIYIIIEYCQYGSLRNYLKRSRHAEFENQVGSGPVEGTTDDYNVTPKDILSFAWQISKGMSYLTDMKLVHRDLAARNVLLATGKVCKISDFGLTRDVYEGDLYFKRSKGRVPVKWMALESLVDNVYTSKSDVWGFGVLLWELVTLGTLPYPGVQPEMLFTLLKAGYRMEKPDNCSQELYDVMLQCWAEDPNRRPCFQDLTGIFEGMIQADVDYLELRSLIVTNRSYFDSVPHPDPPQQFRDAPPQIQVADEQMDDDFSQQQFRDNSETSQDSSPQLEELQNPDSDWSPPSGFTDGDTYLVARTDIRRPRREESTEPLLAPITPTSMGIARTALTAASHAHNPAYSPTNDILPQPLHYSTLASRPDEEDIHTLECCRSEEDSDSGRATGDSGYATEEGRGRWKGDHHKGGMSSQTVSSSSPKGSSYSPIPGHSRNPEDDQDAEDDQDTSEDLEERQELLNEDLLGHLTPSPEPAHTAHSTRTAHSTSHAAHNTPVIV